MISENRTLAGQSGVCGFEGAMASTYDDLCLEMRDFQKAQRALVDRVRSFCYRSTSQLEVLEIGCGTGITTGLLLSEVENVNVTSLDSDLTMVEKARRRTYVHRNRVNLECANAVSFCTSAQRKWSVVISAFTLHNLEASQQNELLKSVRRVVLPGGIFLLADFAVRNGDRRITSFCQHIEEMFDVLVPKRQFMALREWTIHAVEDMSETRIQDEEKLIAMLKKADFPNPHSSFMGPLEALFECRIPSGEAV